jgi:hypothetical protein
VEAEVVETSPSNLWSSRPIDRGPLRKKWYLKEGVPTDQVASSASHITPHSSAVSSGNSHLWSESFEMQVARISVLIEQEVTVPSLRTFPVISLTMGKYSSMALLVKLQDWSSKLKASTELSVEASYYNIRTDSWEPILEPVVDPRNESQYVSWAVKAKVIRQPPTHAKHHTEAATEKPEDDGEEEEEETVGLSVDVCAENALQLTVTKSSLSIFTELAQAYTEKKVMVLEEVDTPETYDALFMVVNKLGKKFPVTVKPAHTLKVHGAYSLILRHDDPALPLHPTEGVAKMRPGELLPRDSHLSRVHIVQLQVRALSKLQTSAAIQ